LQNYYAIFGPEFSFRFYSKLGTFDLVTVSMRQSVAEQSVPERLFLNDALSLKMSLEKYAPWIIHPGGIRPNMLDNLSLFILSCSRGLGHMFQIVIKMAILNIFSDHVQVDICRVLLTLSEIGQVGHT
jgi:hypothetical protein